MRQIADYYIADINSFKKKLYNWASQFKQSVSFIGSTHKEQGLYLKYDMLVAIDAISELSSEKNSFESLKAYHDELKDWIFGYLSYDLKNEIEDLKSENIDSFGIPNLYFFSTKMDFSNYW